LRFTRPICSIAVASLLTVGAPTAIRPQSGRGRPRVPSPSQPAPVKTAVNIPEAAAVVKQEQAGNLSRFVLRNGMTVVLSEQHTYPCAVAVAYFKMGMLSGLDRRVGRVLQKALIAGDLRAAPFRNARAIRSLGGELTAEATADHAYYCTLTSSKSIEDALAGQSDMLLHPSFESDSARRAALAIEAEDVRACEDPTNDSTERIEPALPADPKGPVSGNVGLAAVATQERLHDFYRKYYRPDRLVICVTGDIPTFDTLVQIERLYGYFGAPDAGGEQGEKNSSSTDSRPTLEAPETAESRASSQRPAEGVPQGESGSGAQKLLYLEKRGNLSQSIVTAGYRVPGLKSDDWPALYVLTALLGKGRGSALGLALFLSQGIVNHVDARYSAGPDTGLMSIQLWLAPDAIDHAEASLFKEIDRLIKAPPDLAELARAKTVAELMLDETGQGLIGTALTMVEQNAATDSIATAASVKSRIRSVSPEDIQFVAGRYLALSNLSIREYEPLTAPTRSFDSASFARTALSWAPGLAQSTNVPARAKRAGTASPKVSEKEIAARNQAEAESENVMPLPVKDFSTLNGPRVFVREDHTRPEVTITILFQGGRISETDANSGITDLMLRVLLYGTPRISREQAAISLGRLGADVRIINEPDHFGFIMTCLSSSAGEALRLMRDLIEVPAFRDADIDRAKQEQLGSIRASRDYEMQMSYYLLRESGFSGHPYGKRPHGSEANLSKLKVDDLRDWYTKTIKSQFPLAIIVGDTEGSALVSEGIAGEFKRRDLADTIKAPIPRRASYAEKAEPGRCSVTIEHIGFAGPRLDSGDLGPLHLIEEFLNGTGGGFEEDLVYQQGVAWAVWLGNKAMLTGGLVYAGIESAPDDRPRARAATLSKLQQISVSGLGGPDLSTAQLLSATSAFQALSCQQERALAYAEALFTKRDPSYVDSLSETFEKVSAADVKRVASAYLKPGGFYVGTVQGTGSATPSAPVH